MVFQLLMFSGRRLSPPTRHTVRFWDEFAVTSKLCILPLMLSAALESTAIISGPKNSLVSAPSMINLYSARPRKGVSQKGLRVQLTLPVDGSNRFFSPTIFHGWL